MAKQADRDAAVFEKYKKKYEAQRDKQNAKKAQKNQKQSQNSRLNEDDLIVDQIIKGL